MKYHKIRGIPLSVCTAEQRVAYNMAYRIYIVYNESYSLLQTQQQKSEFLSKVIHDLLEYIQDYCYTGKYDLDAAFCALNAGLENYMNSEVRVLNDYKDIGEMFPALYLSST